MHTLTKHLKAVALGLTLAGAIAVAIPTYAQESTPAPQEAGLTPPVTAAHPAAGPPRRQNASRQESIGVVTGLAVGAVAAGPFGAIVGAAAGAWLGDRYHKQQVRNVALSRSIAEEQERSAKLDGTLQLADELQTDICFRTNDATVSAAAMSPLRRLGALAATLPDVKLRVAGYTDPRGSEQVNDVLSLRRAQAVAAVLESAGVNREQLIVEGHGETAAHSQVGDLDGYALDRRVTVSLERSTEQVARRE